MNQSTLVNQSGLPASLASAVIDQCGGWDDFVEMASDVADHGADTGLPGWTWHSDTCQFTAANRAAIAEYSEQYAESLGHDALKMIQGFNCLGSDYSLSEIGRCLYGSGDDSSILNALAWFCLEELCRAYVDGVES